MAKMKRFRVVDVYDSEHETAFNDYDNPPESFDLLSKITIKEVILNLDYIVSVDRVCKYTNLYDWVVEIHMIDGSKYQVIERPENLVD